MTVRAWATAGAAAIALAACAQYIRGSVLVVDADGEAIGVEVVDGSGVRQPLIHVGMAYVAIPRVEGAVRVRCRDGNTAEQGYVTAHLHTWLKLDGTQRCQTTFL